MRRCRLCLRSPALPRRVTPHLLPILAHESSIWEGKETKGVVKFHAPNFIPSVMPCDQGERGKRWEESLADGWGSSRFMAWNGSVICDRLPLIAVSFDSVGRRSYSRSNPSHAAGIEHHSRPTTVIRHDDDDGGGDDDDFFPELLQRNSCDKVERALSASDATAAGDTLSFI